MSVVTNRVWDSQLTGSVFWNTSSPDKLGLYYPGPGTFGTHTSDYIVSSIKEDQTVEKAKLHDLSYSADEIYQFNGNLVPEVGVIGTATMASGTDTYCQGLVPGTYALRLDGVDDIVRLSGAPTPTLGYVNNFTIEFLVKPLKLHTSEATIVRHGGTDETEARNLTYIIDFQFDNQLRFFYESGAGVNRTYTTNYTLEPGTWYHIAYTRADGTNKLYVNGKMIVRDVQVAGTGGTDGILSVGGTESGTNESNIAIQSLKFIPSVLTPKQILLEARRTLGPNFRP